MRLYYSPGTISVAVAIALHEAGLAFEAQPVNFKEGEQTSPDYLTRNPKGRVPTLETHGQYLTETGALLDYIAALAPEAHLVPDDPLDAVHMRSVMYYLASTMHVNHAHRMRGTRWADNPESHVDMIAKVPETMAQSAQYVQDHGLRGDYVTGERLSLADPYVFAVCNWLEGDGVPLADYPKLAAFMERMRARPAVQAVIAQGILPS